MKQQTSNAEPNWHSTPYGNYSSLFIKPWMLRNELSILNNWLMSITQPMNDSPTPPLPFWCLRVNGISFLSNYCYFFLSSFLPTRPPVLWALIGGSITEGKAQQLITENYTNLRKKKNKKTTTNQQTNILFQLSEPDPGESHFLASKDCLQSLPWYAHVDIWRSLDVFFFFFLFIFSFFLMVCKSI